MADADDDSWLYGDDNDEEDTTVEEAPLKAPLLDPEQSELEAPPPIEDGEADSTVEEEKAPDDNDSSDESDDDGINFTIDHVKINDAKESYKNMQVSHFCRGEINAEMYFLIYLTILKQKVC